MNGPASRRSILTGLVALPAAVAVSVAVAHAAADPDLLRLVEAVEATDKAVDDTHRYEDSTGLTFPVDEFKRLCKAAADARGAVALAPVRNRADLSLKVRALRAASYDPAYIREEVEYGCKDWCYANNLALAIAGDLMRLEEAGL